MLTAFVLSGTGSLAAQHVGMLQALADRRISPDLLIGTSSGAANAAFVAGFGAGPAALRRLAQIWADLGRWNLLPPSRRRIGPSVRRGGAPCCSPVPLRRLLGSRLPYVRVEDARIPVHFRARDAHTGAEVWLSDGLVVSAVMASCAVVGVLPPVERRGRTLRDGSVGLSSAVERAAELGADRIIVLPAHGPGAAGPSWLHPRLIVLPAPVTRGVRPADFRHAPTLVRVARDRTGAWLDTAGVSAESIRSRLASQAHDEAHDRISRAIRPPSLDLQHAAL